MMENDGNEQKRGKHFSPCGGVGEFDYGWVSIADSPPVRIAEELYVWYGGRRNLHWSPPPFHHLGSIGLARLRIDGFCSLSAGDKEGFIITKPFTAGKLLMVNADTRGGYLDAEILKQNGENLPGFSRKKFDRITDENATLRKLTWGRKSLLQPIAGKPIRLKIILKNARIYSFWIG